MKLHQQKVLKNKVLNFIKNMSYYLQNTGKQGLYSCHMTDIM